MPTTWETFPIKFEGGLITNRGRLEHGVDFPGSATVLQNYEADVQGGYSRILGFSKFSEIAVPNTGIVKGVMAVSPSRVVAARGANFSWSDGAAWTSLLVIPNTNYERIHYDRYNYGSGDKYVVVDGLNTPAFYNVAANTMAYGVGFPADVVGASFVKNFKNHLFYAVDNNLVFSAPYSDTDFTPGSGGGIINIGDEITGLIAFREQLFIFCLSKIFRLSGNALADFQIDPVTTNTGCVAGHTIQEVGGDIMYLSTDGVRYLSASERIDDFGLNRASEKIQSEFIRATASGGMFCATTVSTKNQYRIFVYQDTDQITKAKGFIAVKFSDQTTENISWSTTVGMKVYATSKYTFDQGEIHYFSNESGYVYKMESGSSFDGAGIESIFETPYMPLNDPKIRKTVFKHSLYTRMSSKAQLYLNVLFDYNKNATNTPPTVTISESSSDNTYGDSGSVYGVSIYGSGSEVQFYNNIMGSGFTVALRYTNTSTEPSFNLNFGVLEFKTNERR